MPELFTSWRDPRFGYEAVFEDDGRTAYAYLVKGGRLLSVAWLYNAPDWLAMPGPERGQAIPNPCGLPLPPGLPRPEDESHLTCEWRHSGEDVQAEILLQGFPLGLLCTRSAVGYAGLATETTPHARTYRDGGLMLIDFSVAHAESGDSVRVQDDGEVAYAYYLRNGEVIGHVWLYNRAVSPIEEPWSQPNGAQPFLNPARFANRAEHLPLTSGDFDLRFMHRDGLWTAAIYLRGKILAVVGEAHFPGWCVLAREDGPLALTV